MSCRTVCDVVVGVLLIAFASRSVSAQLNIAYTEGYRPMLDLAGSLKDLADSDTKRQDFTGVSSVGSKYSSQLDRLIAGLDGIGRSMKDGSNLTWAADVRSRPLAAARAAKAKAEAVKKQGDDKADCRAQVIDLQAAIATLSDEFRACNRAHEDRRRELLDGFDVVRAKWWDATKADRRPSDDLGQRAASLRDKRNEAQTRAGAAGKLYLAAQDQCDRARADLFAADKERTPDEVKARYEAWGKAEDLVKRVAAAAVAADKEAADAGRSHLEAEQAWQQALETYTKEAVEGDGLYKIVLERHLKAYELSQEYKPISL